MHTVERYCSDEMQAPSLANIHNCSKIFSCLLLERLRTFCRLKHGSVKRLNYVYFLIVSFFPPFNISDYFEYFKPDFTLHPDTTTRIENLNSKSVSNLSIVTLCIGYGLLDNGSGIESEET